MRIFGSNKHISIDIGAKEIKIVEGKATKKNISIHNAFTIKVPRDIYFDGTILDMDQLSYLLKASLKENKIISKMATVVVNSTNIITREISLPKVTDAEIESILKYQAEDYIPIEPEDYIFQYTHLGSIFEEGVERLNLLLIATPKAMVESHLDLVSKIGLKPKAMDFQGNSLSKLFNYNDIFNKINPTNGKTIVSVDMGYDNSKVNITLNAELKVSRVINTGASLFMKDIKTIMDLEEEEILNRIKDIEFIDEENIFDNENSVMINSLNNTISLILSGVDMVIKYYISRDVGNKIDFIVLQGGLSNINGLENKFSNFFNINTCKLHSFDKIKSNEDMGIYSNAIGGLIRLDEV